MALSIPTGSPDLFSAWGSIACDRLLDEDKFPLFDSFPFFFLFFVFGRLLPRDFLFLVLWLQESSPALSLALLFLPFLSGMLRNFSSVPLL